jgi:uncharacterized protein YjiS (DUF1127 family)
MSMLNSISDFSPSHIAVRRSIKVFARWIVRIANSWIAGIIAQREHQANLTILRSLSDRELRDMGLKRSQIGVGLAEAAKDRARFQSQLAKQS